LNEDIKSIAERYAREGYVALAVDMYNGESTSDPTKARELSTKVRNDTGEAFKNLRAAVSHLKSRPDVNPDKLASVGWCFGGGWSYEMASNNLGIKASVMYYGQFDPEDDFKMMRAHILGGQGFGRVTLHYLAYML
jgi:carboxymethylenebutenolidase